jgi:phosphoribosylformylglycinamidine (FGAM) synthase PurS component
VTRRAVAISLKIPDNTAYTALVALRRLGIEIERVERSEIFLFDDAGDVDALAARIRADETLFNPNKHRLSVLDAPRPQWGEVWIERLETRGDRATSWRLFAARGVPAKRPVLEAAIERLLCNPAIERAVTALDERDRDIRGLGE